MITWQVLMNELRQPELEDARNPDPLQSLASTLAGYPGRPKSEADRPVAAATAARRKLQLPPMDPPSRIDNFAGDVLRTRRGHAGSEQFPPVHTKGMPTATGHDCLSPPQTQSDNLPSPTTCLPAVEEQEHVATHIEATASPHDFECSPISAGSTGQARDTSSDDWSRKMSETETGRAEATTVAGQGADSSSG